MIKAIVFDLGGVLISLDKARCIRAFKEIAGFDRIEEFLDTSHQRGMIGDLEAGRISVAEFFAECRKYCRPGVSDAEIRRCFHALLDPMTPETAALLRQLARRLELYILTNNSSVTMEKTYEDARKTGIDLQATFRQIFVSQDLKMLKPSQEIFAHVIRAIGLPPEEILYVDDSPRNVEAARMAGMNALHHVPGRDLAETLSAVLAPTDTR